MKKGFLIFGIVLIALLVQALLKPVFDQLELLSYDTRAKVAVDDGPFSNKFSHADKNIVIVRIDDYSRNEISKNPQLDIGSWPWRRSVWAQTLRFIERGEPKAVLFDIIFNDVNNDASYDTTFSRTLRRYDNVVLATSLNNQKVLMDQAQASLKDVVNSDFTPTSNPLDVQNYDKKVDDEITFYSHAPLSDIYTEHNTIGVVNKVVGRDSVIRNAQPIFKLIKGDETYYMPSLAFAGFLKYMGEDGPIVIKNKKIFYKGRVIPINNEGITPISWHGAGNDYTSVPISKILLNWGRRKDIKPDFFKDKIVIIGRTEAGTDIHASSVNPSYAGPEANATAIDNFINDSDINNKQARKFISQASLWVEYGLIILFCSLLVAVVMTSKNALMAFLNSALLVVSYILICVYAFVYPSLRVWIPMVVPLYYLLFTGAVVFSVRLYRESAKKAEVMSMFGKFVSPKVLSTLMKDTEHLVLKNSKKHITVMFCDVKDFTSLSEKCNPEQLVENLNELFNEIVNIIFENNGTVDKFVGDCVMAYWGDPIASEDDAYMAVKTAIDIRKKVDDLKIANIKEGKIVFDVKIGINTGDALLGLAGSDKIMSYTAMGDAVNTASRLEASCSKLKRDILISKATLEETKGKIVVMDVGTIDVKGKDQKIEVYEPIGLTEG